MNKTNLQNEMKSIFDAMLKNIDDNAKSDPLFEFIASKKEWLGDPEEMDCMIASPFENIISTVVKTALKTDDDEICAIYTDWDFFDCHVTKLCTKLYGGMCSADKGRYIVKSFIQYRLTGSLPLFDPKPENYHHPETGTPEQWMRFVKGLFFLKYGNPEKYLSALNDLMEVRK